MNGKKGFSVSLAILVLSVASLAGCSPGSNSSSDSSNNSSSSNASTAATKASGPVKIEVFGNSQSVKMPQPDQDVIKQGLESKLGIDLNLNVFMGSADDYNNQLNVRMATSDFPDYFNIRNRTTLKDYAEKGILLDLTPYMDQLKDYVKYVGDEALEAGKVNGKQYSIVRPGGTNQYSYWIRKDWLDKLGMKAPTNLDEFYQVAKAFVEKDPDGNGKNDTYALSGTAMDTFNPLFGAFGMAQPGSIMIKDGKIVSTYHDPAMKDALAYLKKLTDAKLVDPEFMSNKYADVQQKLYQGQYGIAFIHWPNMMKDEFISQWQKINPKAEWIQLNPPQGPGGSFNSTESAIKAGALHALPKSLEKQPEKLKKVLELLNYTATKEGSRLVWYGIEGKHYTLQNDKVIPTDLMDKEGGYFTVYQFTGRQDSEYLKIKFAKLENYVTFADQVPKLKVYDSAIVYPSTLNTSDAKRYGGEEIIKFIYGKAPLDKYDDFLKTLDTTYQYKAIMQESEKQLKEQKFLK